MDSAEHRTAADCGTAPPASMPPYRESATVQELHRALSDMFRGLPARVEPATEAGFVPVVLPSGYRWHVHPVDPARGSGSCVADLATPERELMNVRVDLATTDPAAAAERVVGLAVACHPRSGSEVASRIARRTLAEAEIAMFDPDELLAGQ